MKMCQPHWDALRAAVESRGLGYLIAANSRDAHARAVSELQGKSEADDFDPLVAAHNMIWSKSIETFGLGIMGDFCPVCEFLKVCPLPPTGHKYATNDSYFIDGPADAVLEIAKELKLFPATVSEPTP